MPSRTARDLLVTELRDIYSAEKQLSKALPRLVKQVSHQGLRAKLEERVQENERLIEELDVAFETLGVSKGRKKCEAMEGLIEEANSLREEIEEPEVLDAALIGAVQKVEHYCLAAWGTAAAFGRAVGEDEAVQGLVRALDVGKEYDQELTELAEREVNPAMIRASEGEEDMADEEEGDEEGGDKSKSRSRQASSGRSQSAAKPQSRSRGSGQDDDDRREEESRSFKRGEDSDEESRDSGSKSASAAKEGSKSGGSDDLKAREYRDEDGNVRHHTRTYMEQQKGRE